MIFNGEIFNYIELRATLERQGHVFATHSDTEVIVHLYEQHGDAFVEHLNGQFAIALWDDRRVTQMLVEQHGNIVSAMEARDADGAAAYMHEHVMTAGRLREERAGS